MKSWYTYDPYQDGITTKLVENRSAFEGYLKQMYNIPEITIEYKRASKEVKYPETYTDCYNRYQSFFKMCANKYFDSSSLKDRTKPMVLICVSHGVPAHNGFLNVFNPDKDAVYVDYGAVTVVEAKPEDSI